jgi:hypothetical protein
MEEKGSQKIYLQPLLVGLLRKKLIFLNNFNFCYCFVYFSFRLYLYLWGGGEVSETCPVHQSSIILRR